MHSKFYKPKFWKFFPSKIKSANADNYIDICKCTPKLRNSSKVMEKRKYRVQMQLILNYWIKTFSHRFETKKKQVFSNAS